MLFRIRIEINEEAMTKYNFKVLAVHAEFLIGCKGYEIGKYTLEGKLIDQDRLRLA